MIGLPTTVGNSQAHGDDIPLVPVSRRQFTTRIAVIIAMYEPPWPLMCAASHRRFAAT